MNQSRTMNRIKAIASAVILAFTLEQLAFAAPASPSTVMSMQPIRINLPKDVAHIDEVYNGSSGNPRLILIQDAHTNVSGQLNIAEIISELVSEHKVRYVFTEAGMGDNSLSALRSSASKKIRKQIGLEYLRKGRLKGTEYLSLATDLDFKIWGVEDPDLYKDAFDSYKFIVEKRGTTLPQLNTLLADSQFLKEKIFNYELRDFDSIRLKYLGEKIKVSDYISTLETYLNSEEIDIFPAFKKLLEIQRLEKNIRFEKTESERNRFISAFQDFWNGSNVEPDGEEVIGSALESIRKKGGELTYQHFKRKLELLIASGKISADSFKHEYPDLNAYMVYADRAFELDMRAVVDELKHVEDFISEKLIHSSDERDLMRADSNLRVYKKLLEMQATPSEYRRARFLSDDNGYTETVGILNRLLMSLQGYYEKTGIINPELQSSIRTSLDFYRLAGDRDNVFISEALNKLQTEKQSIAILVTGGFHTPNLTEMLRTRNISYISLQPQISHETDHDRYERMLLHQNLSASWKKRVLAQKSSAVSQNAFSMDLLNVVVRDPVEFNQLKLALGASETQFSRAGPVDGNTGSVSGESETISGFRKYFGSLKISASRLSESVKQRIRKYIPGFILDFIGRFTGQKKEGNSSAEPEDEKISHLYTEMAAAISEQHHDNDLNRITIDSSFHPDLFAAGLTPKSMRYVFAEILKNAFDEPATGQVRISAEESESRIAIDVDNEGEVDWSALWFTFLDKLTKNRIYVDTETLAYRVIPAAESPGPAERNIGVAEFFVMLNAHHFASQVSLINGKLELKTEAYESADQDALEQGIARGDVEPDLVKQLISRLSDQQLAEYFEIIPFGLLNQAAAGRMWKSPVSNSLVIVNETPDQREYIPYSLSSFMVDHAESIPEINILPMIQKVTRAETPVQEKQKRKEYGGMGVGLFVSARLLIAAGGDIQIASLPKGGTRVKIILNKYTPDIQSDYVHSASKQINVELIEPEASRHIFKNSESASKIFEKWPSDVINITVQQDDAQQLAFWVRDKDEKELGVRIKFDKTAATASIEFFSVQGPIVGEQLGFDAQIKSVGGADRERIHRFLKTNFFPQFTKLLKQNAAGIYQLRISHAKALTNAVDFADYFLDDTEDGGLTFLLGEGNAGARLAEESRLIDPSADNVRIRQTFTEENIEIPLLKENAITQRLSETTVIVMAGGQGTRAQVGHKPTYKIGGLSLLERTVNGLKALGVPDENILVVGPKNSSEIEWPAGIKPIDTQAEDFHNAVLSALKHVRDNRPSNQVMILSGDNVFHLQSTAEALYGENERAVIIGENEGGKGLQVKTNRAGVIKSYDVDYSGDGPYPVGWFIPVSDLDDLERVSGPDDKNLKGLERLLYEKHTLFTAPRAVYDPELNYSFNLNYPKDLGRLSEWTKINPRAYGDAYMLDANGPVFKAIDTHNKNNPDWQTARKQTQSAGIMKNLKSMTAAWIGMASVFTWLLLGAWFTQAVFSQAGWTSLDRWSAGNLFLIFALTIGIPSAALSFYTTLNLFMGIRILTSRINPPALKELSDSDLPTLTIVAPVKNEHPDVVRRTIQSAYESGYPDGKLQILLVSGYGPGERNDQYHDNYRELIDELDPQGKVIALVEVDQSERISETGTLANGKSFNINHVLMNGVNPAAKTIWGKYFSIADADSYFAPGALRAMMSAAMEQRSESSLETGIIQFRRVVDAGSDTDFGHFFMAMRQNLHDVVLDSFVSPLRFDSGFVGNFGHGNLITTSAAIEVGGFNEDQKIEDLDMAFKLKEAGYRVLFNNDVSLGEGIALGGSGFFARAGKIARGDLNLLQDWGWRILFSERFTTVEKIHTLIHLLRGIGTFALTILSVMLPVIFASGQSLYFSQWAYAVTAGVFYLTVFPSIYFIHSQPVVVGAVIVRLLFAGQFRQAIDLFLSYPSQYIYLMATNPVMGLTSLKVAVTGKLEVFTPTEKKQAGESTLLEKASLIFGLGTLGVTVAMFPLSMALSVFGVFGVYLLASYVYKSYLRPRIMFPQLKEDSTGARLTSEIQNGSSDLSELIISFGKYFDYGSVFGPKRQQAEALKKKGIEELFKNINPQLSKPLLRQFLDAVAPERNLKDIQKIEFISKLGEGDFRSSYLIEITVADQVYRLTAKISAGPELKYRKHQAVSAIARKNHGASKTFQGVWEMQGGYTVLLRDYYGGASVKDVYEDAREKKLKLAEDSTEMSAIDEKISRMMNHLNESVVELWADTHGMATDFHSSNFLADTDNDLAVRIVDYGLIPTKSTEISKIEFTESGQPVFYNDSNEEVEKSFMSVGYSDMRSKFISAFHEPYTIYLEDENGYEYETVHLIPFDEQTFTESVVRYFSKRGDFGVLSDEAILETAGKIKEFVPLVVKFRPDLLNDELLQASGLSDDEAGLQVNQPDQTQALEGARSAELVSSDDAAGRALDQKIEQFFGKGYFTDLTEDTRTNADVLTVHVRHADPEGKFRDRETSGAFRIIISDTSSPSLITVFPNLPATGEQLGTAVIAMQLLSLKHERKIASDVIVNNASESLNTSLTRLLQYGFTIQSTLARVSDDIRYYSIRIQIPEISSDLYKKWKDQNTFNTQKTADSSDVDPDKLTDENTWADSKLIDYLRKSVQESDDDNFRGLVLIDRNSDPNSEVIYYAPITKDGNPAIFDRSVTEFQTRLVRNQALQEPRMFPSIGVVLNKRDSIKTFLWANFILFDRTPDRAGKSSGPLSGRFMVITRDRSEEERIAQEILSEYQQMTSGTGARLAGTENDDELPDLNNITAINAGESHYDNSGNFLMVIIPEDQNKPVIKIPRPNNRFDETVASYDLAIERLGGVAADTQKIENAVVYFNDQSVHYPLVFAQERVVPIRTELLSNEQETVRNSLRDVRGVLEEMYARGVHNLDHKIDTAYGRRISDGRVVITDLSHLYSTLDNHYQILMDDDFNMKLYNTSVLRILAPNVSFTSADLDAGNLREVWESGLDRIARMPSDWINPVSLTRREPPSDSDEGSRLAGEDSDLQPNQFDQEAIRARRALTNIPDFYKETETDSNEYTYQSQAQASRLAGDFISSSRKYDAGNWKGYTDEVLAGLSGTDRYLFVERVAGEFNEQNISGIYIDPTVRVQDLISWSRKDSESALDIRQSESGTLELNIKNLFPGEIESFNQLIQRGIHDEPITVQHDGSSSDSMGYTESTVYRKFFDSAVPGFDGLRRVDQVATRYALKMITGELYRQGYNFGFKIDSCCWGAADLSRDIVIGTVYPVKGDGLSTRQWTRAQKLIHYLSRRFIGETGYGADISRPDYADSGTIDEAGGKWDYTTETFLRKFFESELPKPDFEPLQPYRETNLYGGEGNVSRDFDELNQMHSDLQHPQGQGRITDEIDRWIAKGIRPDVLVIGAGRGLVPVRLLQRYQEQIQLHAINGPESFSEDLLHSPMTLTYQLRNENLSEAQAEKLILKIREHYEIADVDQSFGKFEDQKFHIIVVAQATMQYLDKISVLERMRRHLVQDGVYITDLDIFSIHDRNDGKRLSVKSFFESLSPQYKIFGANFGDGGILPPDVYASLLYRNTDPDADTSIPLQESSGNSVFITGPGARLASAEEENIATIEPENQLVDSSKVRDLIERLNISRNKKAVFIGPGNPNLRYGPAMGEYEKSSERIRWEFHLLNAGLPVEIYEPGYLNDWYRKTDSPLGSYRQGMKAFRYYQDSDDRPDSAGFISAGAFFSDGPTNISDAVKEQSAHKIAQTLALGGYLHLAHYRAVRGEKERSDVWFNAIKNLLAERGRKLVLVAKGHEDEAVPLAHNWEIFRVEPVSGASSAARLADVWSDQINRFLNGVVANLGNQIVLAEEAAQVPIELQGDTAIFELTRGTEKTVSVKEVTEFGFLYDQNPGNNRQSFDISEARSAESLRQKLDILTDDRSTVSARESATDRALFNQAISAVPRIDDKPVVAVVDLSPFKNLTERDPRFESMIQVFVNAFLRDGHYLRFQGASEERIRAANDFAESIALKLKNKDAVSGILRQEDSNPENVFEVVLRKAGSSLAEKVRDRVYVSIAEIPDDPHFVAELGSTALLMKTIGESVRFEREEDVIDSDTVHTGLISAVNILYSSETVIGLNEVLWTLSADSRADNLMIGFIRVDNVIMALRMQSRQIDIMA